MSEKRFTKECGNNGMTCRIWDNGLPMTTDEVVDTLNEQQSTIEQKDKQLERLYNYFQDYLKDEMSGNAFSEMWDFVKEDGEWEDE